MIPDMLEVKDVLKAKGETLTPNDFRFNNVLLERIGAEPLIEAASLHPAGRVGLHNSPGFMSGAELAALQFARDFRLQPYNAYRERFGLARYSSYMELTEDAAMAKELEALYGPSIENLEFVVGLFAEHHDKETSFGELLRTMVAVDAFSQVFTNPLLSTQCFGLESAFGSVGMQIFNETKALEDIVRRNAPPGVKVLARFHLDKHAGHGRTT
jgi:prostaglandin-endoperoxide synthase 2